MIKKINKNKKRVLRHKKIRNRLQGTPERPRLNVFRSSNHIYAQIIDDVAGNTIASVSTIDKELCDEVKTLTKKEAARVIGKAVAKKAIEKGVKEVIFDRGGYVYHGRIAELAEGARESGLKF